ncbi:TonB-dependent receptor [Psychrobacter sp. HD31]|uniref:TonB-dependent receptor n=1 Tax=Psychrobacter sp. HD31 TaxID=3112003 RepID=UPI003DA6B39C
MKTYQKLTLSLLTICISQQLYAETTDVQVVKENEDTPTTTLDTIVITAGKIERTSQDTVDSVNITTADQIQDDPSLDDFTDILQKAPNVSVTNETSFTIRGISRTGSGGGAADTFSVTVDGVSQNYMANQPGIISTWDLQQVEVLRGPQSTTAGRNALAGAMLVKSKDPEFEQGGKVQVGYGTDNTYQLALANTGAITDKLAYRISTEHKHTDGHYTNNVQNKDDWNSQTNTSIRGKLLYEINDDSDIMLTASHVDYDRNGIRSSIHPTKRINADNSPVYFDTDVTNLSLEYNNYLTDNWSLKSTTGYQDLTFDRESDRDGAAGDARHNNDRSANNWSEELLFNYDNDDNIKAVVGLYATEGEFVNQLETLNVPYSIRGFNILADYTTHQTDEYTNYAVFTNIDYKVNPNLTLIGGLRLDYDKRTIKADPNAKLVKGTGIPPIDAFAQGIINTIGGDFDADNTQKVLLPKIGFDYAWNDNLNTGIVYQRGYRPGGVSANVVTQSSHEYDEEYTDNYEFSLRMKNDDFSLASNLFYTDWKDQQVYVSGKSGLPGDISVVNAGKSHLYGIEIETAYQITPELELTGGIGVVKTKFDEFIDNGVDYSGKEFDYARQLTANAGATYRSPEGWFIGGYATHQGKGWEDLSNTAKIDTYTLVNLKAGYEADNWGAYVNVNNAFDETYIANTLSYNLPDTYELGDPRTLGVTVNYEW